MSWTNAPPAQISVPTNATAVTLNATYRAQGTAAITQNENDFYRFQARATGNYVLAAATPTLDTVLGVFNSNGVRIAFNNNVSASDLSSRVTVALTAGQTYYLGTFAASNFFK